MCLVLYIPVICLHVSKLCRQPIKLVSREVVDLYILVVTKTFLFKFIDGANSVHMLALRLISLTSLCRGFTV